MADLPPQALDAPVAACVAQAAAHYNADPQAVIDRILKRRGRSGEVRIVNGKAQLGIYGVPAERLGEVATADLTPERITNDDCVNVAVGVLLQTTAAGPAAARSTANARATPVPATVGQVAMPKLPRLDAGAERCVSAAAAAYSLPERVFRAVLRTEGGWAGLKKRNPNGTYDMGPGQINTIHLPALAKYGISEHMLVNDSCINIYVAAYRLRAEIERAGDFWRGVGNYHSRTPQFHQAYLQKVRAHL